MNQPPILYYPYQDFVSDPTLPDELFLSLKDELKWERRGSTPRSEYYVNWLGYIPYQYGQGAGVREYLPGPTTLTLNYLKIQVENLTGISYEVCFLNRYHNQSDSLGWHADNSPEMDDTRPIAIISLGVEREIWFAPNLPDGKPDTTKVFKQKLQHGSLCLMAAGMQDTHQHRIPKAGFQCGERISLTFRGYVK